MGMRLTLRLRRQDGIGTGMVSRCRPRHRPRLHVERQRAPQRRGEWSGRRLRS